MWLGNGMVELGGGKAVPCVGYEGQCIGKAWSGEATEKHRLAMERQCIDRLSNGMVKLGAGYE